MEFGDNLKRLREQNDWSQMELSKKTGISQSTINNYEHGRKPTWDAIKSLMKAFSCTIQDLDNDTWTQVNNTVTVPKKDVIHTITSPECLDLLEFIDGIDNEQERKDIVSRFINENWKSLKK